MKAILLTIPLLILLSCGTAIGHDFSPTLVRLEETKAGEFQVFKKSNKALALKLPVHCKVDNAESDQYSYKQSYAANCGPMGIKGSTIKMESQDPHQEVMLEIHYLSGETYRKNDDGKTISFLIPQAKSNWLVAMNYLALGVKHILLGFDHLLFVLGILLITLNSRKIFLSITAFTLGHSLTFGLASTGWIHLSPRPVEIIIALSLVFLGLEAARGNKQTLACQKPWLVAVLFGLIHGLGFAGALAEIGFPQNEFLVPLASFNLGVEFGQVAFVLAVVLLWRLFALNRFSIKWPAYMVGSLGVFLLLQRMI
jgi:hydrogenase/urease accessory protein HupE